MTQEILNRMLNARFITHAGVFHADEVMATAILYRMFGHEHQVIRVFNVDAVKPPVSEDDIVYDIGGGPFDHHQRGGNGCRANGIPYAAAGLIWMEYGLDICNGSVDVFEEIDKDLIQGIDAQDNGIQLDTDERCKPLSISNIISSYNPSWDDEGLEQAGFNSAVELAGHVLNRALHRAFSKVRAKAVVNTAIMNAAGGVMILEKFCPWQNHMFTCAEKGGEAMKSLIDKLFYVVYPSKRGGWQWQAVPDAPGSFGQKNSVPESWKGMSGRNLQEITGVETATFCHPNGFTGGAATLEDTLKMADLAIEKGTRNI